MVIVWRSHHSQTETPTQKWIVVTNHTSISSNRVIFQFGIDSITGLWSRSIRLIPGSPTSADLMAPWAVSGIRLRYRVLFFYFFLFPLSTSKSTRAFSAQILNFNVSREKIFILRAASLAPLAKCKNGSTPLMARTTIQVSPSPQTVFFAQLSEALSVSKDYLYKSCHLLYSKTGYSRSISVPQMLGPFGRGGHQDKRLSVALMRHDPEGRRTRTLACFSSFPQSGRRDWNVWHDLYICRSSPRA